METNLINPQNPLFKDQSVMSTQEKKPLDKKILVLIVLGAIIFVLLLLSLIVTAARNKSPVTKKSVPTPTALPITPTIEAKAIPTQYQEITNQIDNELKVNLEFVPPQIDENIGL